MERKKIRPKTRSELMISLVVAGTSRISDTLPADPEPLICRLNELPVNELPVEDHTPDESHGNKAENPADDDLAIPAEPTSDDLLDMASELLEYNQRYIERPEEPQLPIQFANNEDSHAPHLENMEATNGNRGIHDPPLCQSYMETEQSILNESENFMQQASIDDDDQSCLVVSSSESYEPSSQSNISMESQVSSDREEFEPINNEPLPSTSIGRVKHPSVRQERLTHKQNRSKGKEYMGLKKMQETGKWTYVPRPAKALKSVCNCKRGIKYPKTLFCKQFDEVTRKKIFNDLWKLKNDDQKKTFVSAMVDVTVPKDLKNRVEREESRKENSFFFHLKKDNQRLRICKKMFLNTLAISDWYMHSCAASKNEENDEDEESEPQNSDDELVGSAATPRRSHAKARVTPRIAAKMKGLREFMTSLPIMESHYCRKNTSKKYLEPVFQSKSEVYDFYVREVTKRGLETVTLKTFYLEFDKMDFSIYRPRKDQCDTCVGFKVGNVSQEVYESHQRQKELAREEMNNDNNSENAVFTMDMQGVLMSPRLMASAQYYKMKLCIHNFTVFANKTKNVTCYLWHEGEGGVTSNEFASMILNFIEEQQLNEGQEVILWSDGCGNQNRNVNLANALSHLSQKINVTIVQKFLERGHTQMSCDSIHARIENKLKNKLIYTPAGYIEIIETARKNPQPYFVKYLDHTFFQNYSEIGHLTSIRPGYKRGDPTVNDMCALKYTPSGELFFKLSFDEEWKLLDKRKKRASSGAITPLFPARPKIKPDKFTHLQQLKPSIPQDFHSFYDSLLH